MTDTFTGDNFALAASINALLAVPDAALSRPVPGLARQLLASAAARLMPIPAPVERAPGKISDHFTLAEMTHSATGSARKIPNDPPTAILDQLILTADRMEKVRSLLGDKPIRITSAYRSEATNKAVGGSATSAHRTGHAVDFTCPAFGTSAQVAAHLAKHLKDFDQIIEEFGQWVHVGFGPGKRGQLLTARKIAGRTTYTPGIKGV